MLSRLNDIFVVSISLLFFWFSFPFRLSRFNFLSIIYCLNDIICRLNDLISRLNEIFVSHFLVSVLFSDKYRKKSPLSKQYDDLPYCLAFFQNVAVSAKSLNSLT